jgi:hypothetical protein
VARSSPELYWRMKFASCSLPLILAMVTALPAAAAARKHRSEEGKIDREKPRLALRADPAVGFTPVSVILTGHLTGVDMSDRNFCHAAVTWVRIDPGQSERDSLRIREDPACVHPSEEIYVPSTLTKTFDLYRPGSYLIRLEVQAKDGTRVVSPYTRVEVLRVQ